MSGISVGLGVCVAVGVAVDVAVGEGVGVEVGTLVAVGVWVAVDVAVGDGSGGRVGCAANGSDLQAAQSKQNARNTNERRIALNLNGALCFLANGLWFMVSYCSRTDCPSSTPRSAGSDLLAIL